MDKGRGEIGHSFGGVSVFAGMTGKNRHFRDLSQQVLSGVVAKNTQDKYPKNRKNSKSNKEAKKGPEMSSHVAKNAKVSRIFLGNLKHLVTNIAEIARKRKQATFPQPFRQMVQGTVQSL